VGAAVRIRSVPSGEAIKLQSGHGGWSTAMTSELGKMGTVVSVDDQGTVKVKAENANNWLWSPELVEVVVVGTKVWTSATTTTSLPFDSSINSSVLLRKMEDDLATVTLRKGGPQYEKSHIKAAYQARIARRKSGERHDCTQETAEMIGVVIPTHNQEFLKSLTTSTVAGTLSVIIETNPFSMGATRAAYFARLCMPGRTEWEDVVLKEFLYPEDRLFDEYKSQAESSAIGYYLAEKFCREHRVRKPIKYVVTQSHIHTHTRIHIYTFTHLHIYTFTHIHI
jgi:hypothetical protein